MEYIERSAEVVAQDILRSFPALLITGPRQTGKSTLLKHLKPDSVAFFLDLPSTRIGLEQNPEALDPHGTTIVLDEIQKQPALLERLKANIDQRPGEHGLYAITGSEQFQSMRGARESLAGRIGLMTLYPLNVSELIGAGLIGQQRQDLLTCMIRGGYPALWADPAANMLRWFSSYIDTYLERDVELHFGIKRMREYLLFLQLLAVRVGSLLNLSELAKECQISESTAKEWISILERSYIIRLVSPWHGNVSKRLVKMPKVFFVDTGLLCYLLGINSAELLERHPMRGALFENFIFTELLKAVSFSAFRIGLFFYRSHDGAEVDFILERGLERIGIEVKFSEGAKSNSRRHLTELRDAGIIQQGLVVHTGDPFAFPGGAAIGEWGWSQLSAKLAPFLQRA
jgi:predicted AAA+ superfamily ATPase